jgi:hypothetical protein
MEKHFSNSGCEYVILSQTGKQCTIQFSKTGAVRTANIDNLRAGKVRDLYEKTAWGVGYLGKYERTGYHVQAQQLWRNMLKRCYYANDPKGYFSTGVTVDPRWHCFADFLADLPTLDNFKQWRNKEGYQLDKDLRVPGCKVYSPETCMFVTEFANKQAGKLGKRLIGGKWVTTVS